MPAVRCGRSEICKGKKVAVEMRPLVLNQKSHLHPLCALFSNEAYQTETPSFSVCNVT
jgi:hypothetical protein